MVKATHSMLRENFLFKKYQDVCKRSPQFLRPHNALATETITRLSRIIVMEWRCSRRKKWGAV